MNYSKKYSGILLAGGKSSRMGVDKAFMRYDDRYLYEYGLSVLQFFSGDIIISSSDMRFNNQKYSRIEDEIPNLGPLGGIYSCLKRIKSESAIILPCDLPLISIQTIETLIKNSADYEITVALNHNNIPEPLIGIYSRSIIPFIEEMICQKNYKLQFLLSNSKTNFVRFPDKLMKTFLNLNNQSDYLSLP